MYEGPGGIDFFRTAEEWEIWMNVLIIAIMAGLIGYSLGEVQGNKKAGLGE